jgi:hypothetical protein
MTNPPPSPSRAKGKIRAEVKNPPEEATTPKNKFYFRLHRLNDYQAQKTEANANPFASSNEGNRGVDLRARTQEDMLEGWSFQGRRKHAPKLASPRPKTHHTLPRTPQQETTPGGKRVQFHDSEVHPSYFSSLIITILDIGDPFRARIWPVLVREKNVQKETLVHSKNQNRPSLLLSLRITGLAEVNWTQESAWADLTQRLEAELEEKVLRYRLTLKDRPQLEWSWQKESSRGGTECTILAHIDSGSSALSIQNKRHLHWKVLDSTQGMSNDTEFSAPAHNLLMKTETTISEHQESKNRLTSIQASPQVARKKRFTKLNFNLSNPTWANKDGPISSDRQKEDGSQ